MAVIYFDPNAWYRIRCADRSNILAENGAIAHDILTHSSDTDKVVLAPEGDFNGIVSGQMWSFRWTETAGVWTLSNRLYGANAGLEASGSGLKVVQKVEDKPAQRWFVSISAPNGGGKWAFKNMDSESYLGAKAGDHDVVVGGGSGFNWSIEYIRPIRFDAEGGSA